MSATERLFGQGGKTFSVPSVRGSFATGRLMVSAFAEAKNIDSISRMDVTAQMYADLVREPPGERGPSHGWRVTIANKIGTTYVRAEAGVRVRNLWLLGGVLRRDSVNLLPPRLFDTTFAARSDGSATGATAAIRGQLWRFIRADVAAIRWNDSAGFYRPRYQTRSELFIRTNLIERFPSGNLGLLFSAVREYRSGVSFPVTGTQESFRVPGYRTISTLLEIRILSATASWQFLEIS